MAVSGVDKWTYLSRSQAQAEMAVQKLVLSSNIDLTKIADAAPSGVIDGDGIVIIDNGAALPKLSTGQALYSLKGDGQANYTADVGTPVTGGSGSGSTVVVTSAGAKTLSETISEAVTWVTKNPLILVLILFGLSELLGLTSVLGLKKKKRVAVRRR
jgi:hypothetical protein